MSAFPITFIVSACLLAIFIIYFARTHSGQRKRGVDHEALLPLEDETPRVVGSTTDTSAPVANASGEAGAHTEAKADANTDRPPPAEPASGDKRSQ